MKINFPRAMTIEFGDLIRAGRDPEGCHRRCVMLDKQKIDEIRARCEYYRKD